MSFGIPSNRRQFWLSCSIAVMMVATTTGFVVPISTSLLGHSWELYGKNSKRGRLGSLVEDGVVSKTPSRTRKTKRSKPNTSSKKPADGASISPALAEWMASQEDESTTEGTSDNFIESFADTEETPKKQSKTNKKSSNNQRRANQMARKEQEEFRTKQIDIALEALKEALEESGNLQGILSSVKTLLSIPSENNLRQLLATKQKANYRLAWVGSDDAICHVGTGLHKVPLARLQEVFMTCLGKNRLELLEVIRILGPFPNVKNILQGTTKLLGSNENNIKGLQIVMDSMVDGTGKEILAGTDDNVRRVDLQIHFADQRAIVAVVPPESGNVREDPLQDNGSNVLVFIQEKELDEKLNALRVL